MKIHSIALAVGLSALVCGCSTISTRHDYDTEFDFSKLKSYSWIDPTESVGIDDLNQRRVRAAVDRVLASKGFVIGGDSVDFRVAMHGQTRTRVSVTDYGYGSPRRGWYDPGGVDVRQYEEGMLTIVVVDAEKNQLVWRGTATKALARNPSPQKIEQTIQLAVEKLFARFPPP